MSDIAVRAVGLGKRYRIGQREPYKALRDVLANVASAPLRQLASLVSRPAPHEDKRRRARDEHIWALQDVSFEIEQGNVVGIIGRNGAGKSTLLKILSRITRPTAGYAEIRGRVGSLLEVGTGFHPELTGRENVYLNGAILGMKRAEIRLKFDEIVAFAEVEKFLDTPVKHYSSGMYVRLAFAVAAHLEPEILLVDEVLAVGDAAFQKKCLGKMGDVARGGRTVLFVSHNMAAVRMLCREAILLDAGKQAMAGPVEGVVDCYLHNVVRGGAEYTWADVGAAPGNDKARLRAVRILNGDGQPVGGQANTQDPIIVEIEYWVLQPDTVLSLSMSLFSQEGVYVLASSSATDSDWFLRPHPPGLFRSRCVIPGAFLNQGRYSVTPLLVENGRHVIAQSEQAVSVDMVDLGSGRAGYFGYWGGVVRPTLEWKTEYDEAKGTGSGPDSGRQENIT